MTKAETGT